MNWVEVLTLMCAVFLVNIGIIMPIFLWTRAEAASDRRELASHIKKGEDEFKEFRKMWAEETKDFHARLCLIEQQRSK